MRVGDRVVDLSCRDPPDQLLGARRGVLDPAQRRDLGAQLLEQRGVRRLRDDLEPAAEQIVEVVRLLAAEAIDHLRLDRLIGRPEGDDVLARVRHGKAGRRNLRFAGRDRIVDLVCGEDPEPNAEPLGESTRELVFDASRFVGAVIEGRRSVAGHDRNLAGPHDAVEQRWRRRARREHRAHYDGDQSSQLASLGACGSGNYTGISRARRRQSYGGVSPRKGMNRRRLSAEIACNARGSA